MRSGKDVDERIGWDGNVKKKNFIEEQEFVKRTGSPRRDT